MRSAGWLSEMKPSLPLHALLNSVAEMSSVSGAGHLAPFTVFTLKADLKKLMNFRSLSLSFERRGGG